MPPRNTPLSSAVWLRAWGATASDPSHGARPRVDMTAVRASEMESLGPRPYSSDRSPPSPTSSHALRKLPTPVRRM